VFAKSERFFNPAVKLRGINLIKFFHSFLTEINLKKEPEIKSRISEGWKAYQEARKLYYAKDKTVHKDQEALLLFDLTIECGFNDAYADRAFCLQGFNFHFEAIEDFNQAILKSANYAHLYYARGYSKSVVLDYDGSISDLIIAVELSKEKNKLNKQYDNEISKQGYNSVTQFYQDALQEVLVLATLLIQ